MGQTKPTFDWNELRPLAAWAHRTLISVAPYLLIAFVGYFFLLSSQAIDSESEEFSVPQQWNNAISQLGIQPLYPPQEDFQVGDVYAALVTADKTRSRLRDSAIMIGHINLERELLAYHKRRSRIDQTDPDKPAAWHLTIQDGANVALRSIVFPGFQSNLDHSAEGSANILAAAIGGRSQSASAHSIRISNALTYGIEPASAMAYLQIFCEQSQMCQYSLLSQLFEHRHGADIFPQNPEDGQVEIDVHIVTRVFLTSDISLDTSSAREIGASGSTGQPGQAGAPGATIQGTTGLRHAISQDGTMPRPVVFGYHRIGFAAIE